MTMTSPGAVLVLGGARSGKSRFAEGLAKQSGLSLHYVATGQAYDDEMRERIARHKESRAGEGWSTIEEPLELVSCLEKIDDPHRVILVDCLTLWVSNLMMENRRVGAASKELADYLPHAKSRIILVSNEVGLGIVPENATARAFRDHAGRLHQTVAEMAAEVYFIAAGLPLKMKG